MNYSSYELWWLFFAYSFLGWLIETAVVSGKQKKFVSRGAFAGPLCYMYGFSAVLMTVFLWELRTNPVFLFLGCLIVGTAVEWVTGKVLERMNHHKWWDYSGKKWNFDGYICFSYSVLWGSLGCICILFVNEALTILYTLWPKIIQKVLIYVLVGVGAADMLVSLAALLHMQKMMPDTVQNLDHQLSLWTNRLGQWMVTHLENRIVKAYPAMGMSGSVEEREGRFAEGCSFYKIFCLFFIGSFLGDIVETVFCRYSMGRWMSRSSLVWGQFSIVWGLAIAGATALMYKDRNRPDGHIFLVGTFLGGAYEYICSVFTELVFGKVFWDYSKIPFNLGGRINLLFCFFWGIAAVVWIKILYPKISGWIEEIPQRIGKIVTWILAAFMAVDMMVSGLALLRYDSRDDGKAARYQWEKVMDEKFDDARMERIYPSAKKR